ncbi:MAG: type-F conjugative transfer system protein TraW [Candidatus Nitrosotenuis sp.]
MCVKQNAIIKLIIYFICLNGLFNFVNAKNLGAMGVVYPVEEQDLLNAIQTEATINNKEFQKQWNIQIQQAMDRPQPVGLSKTQKSRVWFFDPSVTLPFDLHDQTGNTIISANQVINPLSSYALNETLIFYNADDADQVKWTQEIIHDLKSNYKLILVGGSVIQQTQLLHKPVYFDQQGRLSERFQLQHVPAIITQDGKRLKVSEVLPS